MFWQGSSCFDKDPRKFDKDPRKFNRDPRKFDKDPRIYLEFEGGSLNLLAFENQAATSNGSLEPKFDFMGLKT
jgi:hypothetical protein